MTAKLNWTYDRDGVSQSAQYRGFTIRAKVDSHPENPFSAWDCEPPTLVYTGRRDGFSDYSDGTIGDPLAAMTDAQISRHWRAIAAAVGVSESNLDAEAKTALADERHNVRLGYLSDVTMGGVRRELFLEALASARCGNGSEYLETLAALWRIAGAVAETWSSHGYSQGDWAEGLSVATPEWQKLTGAPKSSHADQCRYAGKLYGYWAWGDVYGFVIDDADDESEADSCWGFYGDDHAESGLEEAAVSSVDSIVRSRAKRRQAKAAELIKARVPLYLRPAILDAAASA